MNIVYKKDNVYTSKKDSLGECYVDDDYYVQKLSNNKYKLKSVRNFLGEPDREHTITKKKLDKYFKPVKNKPLERNICDISDIYFKSIFGGIVVSFLILFFCFIVYESWWDVIINLGLLILCIEFFYFKVLGSIKRVAVIKSIDFYDVLTHKMIVLPIAYACSFFLFLILKYITTIINEIIDLIKYLCTLIVPTIYVLGIIAVVIILLLGFIKVNEKLSQRYINRGNK